MKPPVLRRLLMEDYADAPGWFGRFLFVLNQFMEQTVQIFDKNISFGDNIQAREYSTSFTTGSTYTSGTFDVIKFSWTGSSLPKALWISAIARSDGVLITTPVTITSWRYDNRSIVISYIAGLNNDVKYDISLLAV